MGSPIIPGSSGSSTDPVFLQANSPSTTPLSGNTSKDSLSFYQFLQLVGTTTTKSKQAIFDNQGFQALINQEYFLGVAGQLQLLSQKFQQTKTYAGDIALLTNNYNNSVNAVNSQMNTYNDNISELNDQISAMNDAINQLNSTTPPTQANIQAYNSQVIIYNNYLNNTGNPFIQAYQQDSNSTYNQPTNFDNSVVIPNINDLIKQLNIGIPLQPTLTPATAPAGASTLPLLNNYSGSSVSTISPSSYDSLNNIDTLPPAPSTDSVITTYYNPYAQNMLALIEANNAISASNDQKNNFITFYYQQGFKFDVSKPDSYVDNSSKPSTSTSTGGGSSGPSLTFATVPSTPSAKADLSVALFKVFSQKAANPLPPQAYDQLNALARILLAKIGTNAGLGVINLLGDALKSLPAGSPPINLATATALLQTILKTVGNSGITASAFQKILEGIPGITQAEADIITQKLTLTQNLNLLLLGASAVGIALKDPNLVGNLVNSSLNLPAATPSTPTAAPRPTTPTPAPQQAAPPPPPEPTPTPAPEIDDNTEISQADQANQNLQNLQAQEPTTASPLDDSTTPESLNALASNRTREDNLTQSDSKVSDLLAEPRRAPPPPKNTPIPPPSPSSTTPSPASSNTINLAATNNQNQLTTENLVQNVLEEKRTETLAPTNPQYQKPGDVINQLQQNIQNVLKEDLTNSLPKLASETLVASLTDTKDPHSFASLIASVNADLQKYQDKQLSDQADKIRQDYIRPTQDTTNLLQTVWFSAENLTHNFQAGIMYDNQKLPSNFQRPLSIQV